MECGIKMKKYFITSDTHSFYTPFIKGLNKTGKTIVCGHWHTADFFNNLKNLKKKYDLYESNPIFVSKKYKLIGLDACTAATNKINVLVLKENEL